MLAVLSLLSALFVTTAPLTAPSASAAAGQPFSAADPYVYIAQGSPTTLYRSLTDASGNVEFSAIGAADLTYNAIAYRTADNYIYAVGGGGTSGVAANSLLKIGNQGGYTVLRQLPVGSSSAAFGSDGLFYMVAGSTLRRLNVDNTTGAVTTINTTLNGAAVSVGSQTTGGGIDITFKDGAFWSMGYGYLVRITPGGVVNRWPLSAVAGMTAPSATDQAGAAWTFGNGNLGFSYNGSGTVYQISVANPTAANPTFRLVSTNTGPQSSNNDGTAAPGLPADFTVEKTGPAVFTAGQTLTYTLTVLNQGEGNSSGWTVTDRVPAALTNVQAPSDRCTVAPAVAGQSTLVTCVGGRTEAGESVTIEITATAPTATTGCITNEAEVTGNEADPDDTDNRDTALTCGTSIGLVKSALPVDDVNGNGITDVGDEITYSFAVTNTGNVALSALQVDDPLIGAVTCPTGSVPAGATVTCTADAVHVVTAADVDAGEVVNTATASGLPAGSTTRVTSTPSTVEVPTEEPEPGIGLVKSASPSDPDSFTVGQEITYSFVVSNTGNVPLTGVTVDDTVFSGVGELSPLSCTPSTGALPVNGQIVCEATYVLQQGDVDAGTVENTATATGTPVGGGDDVTSDPSSTMIPLEQGPAVTLVKSATPTTAAAAGDEIAYSFAVTNAGNVTLTDIAIDDPGLPGVTAECPAGSLLPGATVTCTATYEVTQADVDAGTIVNTATASGQPPSGGRTESDESTATVTIPPTPELSLVKTATPDEGDAAGDAISYEFVVTNTGNVTLTDVSVAETAFSGTGDLSALVCESGLASLAPGDSVTCEAEYELTQADVDAGEVVNTAIATGTPPTGPDTTSDPAEATVTIAADPSLTIVKSASAGAEQAGDVITYSFQLTNTGNVTLDPISVTEGSFSGSGEMSAVTCPSVALAPGDDVTCEATYTVTQADVDAGSITNTAVGVGVPPVGPPVESPPSEVTVEFDPEPGLEVIKSAAPNDSASFTVGQEITYSFVATNTGNVTLTDVAIAEGTFTGSGTLSPITPATVASLAPGAQTTFTATYVVTQADVDAGGVTNSATGTGTPPDGPPVESPPTTVEVPSDPQPAVSLVKTATPDEVSEAGEEVSYRFRITNTGNVTLTAPAVEEGTFTGSGELSEIVCPAVAGLLPGAFVDCTATYVVTQADVDAGSVENTATATAQPPTGARVESDESTAIVTIDADPGLSLEKTASTDDASRVGDTITYSFLVTNTGNVTLTDVAVDEGAFTGTGELSPLAPASVASLAPGQEATFTATYVLTQADVDAGSVSNTATGVGVPPDGPPVESPPSTVIVEFDPEPGLSVVKSATPNDAASFTVGQEITYSFVVTNTGNVTLTDVAVAEGTFTGSGTLSPVTPGSIASLAPDEQAVFTATYVLTQADVDAGGVTNSATTTGTPPDGPPIESPPSTVEIPSDPQPAVSLVKSASPDEVAAVGDEVAYTFRVTNTGNVSLTDPAIDEGAFTGTGELSAVECPSGVTLLPGEFVDCTATYAVTQADLDAGTIENTATATAVSPQEVTVESEPSTAVVTALANPGLSVVKSADAEGVSRAGDVVTYTFVATNTGNVTLTDVSVLEGEFTGTGALSPLTPASVASLAPGAEATFTATYVVTQADVDAGSISNSATGTGTPPEGPPVESPPSTVVVGFDPEPGLSVVKSATPSEPAFFTVGREITYSFVATNTGNVTLTDVSIVEGEFTGSGTLSPVAPASVASLAPGAQATFTATYVVTQADVDAGGVTNTATGTGVPPTGPPIESPPTSVEIPSDPAPALSLVKSASSAPITAAGDVLTYTFRVTNTGNVTMTGIAIDEGTFTGTGELSPVTCPDGAASLLPGASVDCEATYVVTQADVDAGSVENTATATGTPPDGPPVETPPSTVIVEIDPQPGLTVVKSVAPLDTDEFVAGAVLEYRFVVTNTGNVTVTDVVVSEDDFTGTGELSAVECPTDVLAPGDQITCTASYTVTQADVDAGSVTNTASVGGNTPGGPPIDSPPSTVTVPSLDAPAIALVKSADVSNISKVGQRVTYSFLVTNTGNTSLTDVVITETEFSGAGKISAITCPEYGTLLPGQQVTCTATYVVQEADLDGADLVNRATATATPPVGADVTSPPSTVRITSIDLPDEIPNTGGTVALGVVALAVLLLVAGGVLLVVVRRRRGGGRVAR
ncbi:DUF7507 domain-containing protein [Microbacterium sp. TNHR37B]|uniref:DUF7507 domain-containing protein n=1 Tax=Microbacterium sp. TNHR37B TaxID=1775956 RepID=UPI0007B1B3CB|nr:DUF11 domain-containing protein [Microbacterium sp. TNHR37B]KZE89663.1 hypothetical protein AVP41_02461 [Microbacterium sp. TNHR37B]